MKGFRLCRQSSHLRLSLLHSLLLNGLYFRISFLSHLQYRTQDIYSVLVLLRCFFPELGVCAQQMCSYRIQIAFHDYQILRQVSQFLSFAVGNFGDFLIFRIKTQLSYNVRPWTDRHKFVVTLLNNFIYPACSFRSPGEDQLLQRNFTLQLILNKWKKICFNKFATVLKFTNVSFRSSKSMIVQNLAPRINRLWLTANGGSVRNLLN
jgi:hypothetical protein